jgi:hypothetical protein
VTWKEATSDQQTQKHHLILPSNPLQNFPNTPATNKEGNHDSDLEGGSARPANTKSTN